MKGIKTSGTETGRLPPGATGNFSKPRRRLSTRELGRLLRAAYSEAHFETAGLAEGEEERLQMTWDAVAKAARKELRP